MPGSQEKEMRKVGNHCQNHPISVSSPRWDHDNWLGMGQSLNAMKFWNKKVPKFLCVTVGITDVCLVKPLAISLLAVQLC